MNWQKYSLKRTMLAENHYVAFCVCSNAKVFLGDFKWKFVGAEGIVDTNRPKASSVSLSMLTNSRRDLPNVLGLVYMPKQNAKTGRYCV